jgi:hypothetical protein
MKQEDIQQLLARYWQCETSLEDEQRLRNLFALNPLPNELKPYQPLAIWQNKQRALQAPARRPKPSAPLYPTLKIAAAILLLLTLGISAYTHYQQEKWMDQLFSNSADGPLDARKDTTDVVAKVSLQPLPEADTLPDIDEPAPPAEVQLE